ncbi:hypothetical protein Dsin_031400 [Dipteronia sinensis]|uniref:Uncharacterized protein n=1 Tax=Dipteronia sinensis TaxID=43782 RepID=A0AAE0DSB3_9ROSI|nr:hypothetical protein Dsin_031400 [Dipteronia sinensis]
MAGLGDGEKCEEDFGGGARGIASGDDVELGPGILGIIFELKFQENEDIINSPSVVAAYRKIDSLAEKNQPDSASVLMIIEAWSPDLHGFKGKDVSKRAISRPFAIAIKAARLYTAWLRYRSVGLKSRIPTIQECLLSSARSQRQIVNRVNVRLNGNGTGKSAIVNYYRRLGTYSVYCLPE